MNCQTCGVEAAISDNFCPSCGASLRNSRLPARREPPPSPELFRRTLVRQAAPAAARAGAFLAAGVLAQWLLRAAGRRAFSGPARKKSATTALAPRESSAPQPVVAVTETVVWRRTVVRR